MRLFSSRLISSFFSSASTTCETLLRLSFVPFPTRYFCRPYAVGFSFFSLTISLIVSKATCCFAVSFCICLFYYKLFIIYLNPLYLTSFSLSNSLVIVYHYYLSLQPPPVDKSKRLSCYDWSLSVNIAIL